MERLVVLLTALWCLVQCSPTQAPTNTRIRSSQVTPKDEANSDDGKKKSDDKNTDDNDKQDGGDDNTKIEPVETITPQNSIDAVVDPLKIVQVMGFVNHDIAQGETLQIRFDDKDGVVTCVSCPKGTQIAQEAHVLTWTPQASDSGLFLFSTRQQKDGTVSEANFNVTITTPTRAPIFEPFEPKATTKLQPLMFDIIAKDPENSQPGAIIYSCSRCPTGMTINSSTGHVEWTPGADQVGIATAIFRASTVYYQVTKLTTTITVNDTDGAPSMTAIDPQIVTEMDTLTFELKAVDPENEPITFRCKSGCDNGAQLNGATVTWTPSIVQSGYYIMTFAASDGKNEASLDVQVIVKDRTMYGALAVSVSDSSGAWKFAFAKDQASKEKASADALSTCGTAQCKVELNFANSCAAIASNATAAAGSYSLSLGSGYATRKLAEATVISACSAKATGSNSAPCKTISWSCSGVGSANEAP
jgi:Domain of unknown function (DUF4189)/Putative Ig domain